MLFILIHESLEHFLVEAFSVGFDSDRAVVVDHDELVGVIEVLNCVTDQRAESCFQNKYIPECVAKTTVVLDFFNSPVGLNKREKMAAAVGRSSALRTSSSTMIDALEKTALASACCMLLGAVNALAKKVDLQFFAFVRHSG